MTRTYRIPDRGPQDIDLLLALSMLNDESTYRMVEDDDGITFYHHLTLESYPVTADTIQACVTGGYADLDESGDVPRLFISSRGRCYAQKFKDLNCSLFRGR